MVREGKQTHYLGTYGTAESRRKYRDFVRDWEARQSKSDKAKSTTAPLRGVMTVKRLVRRFLAWAAGHYSPAADRGDTSTLVNYERDLMEWVARYGTVAVADLTRADLLALRQEWVDAGQITRNINQRMGHIRHVLRWGNEWELVGDDQLASLLRFKGLPEGSGPQPRHISAVSEEAVKAVTSVVTAPVAAMLWLLFYVGMRPGEVSRMRGREVNKEGRAYFGGREVQLPPGPGGVIPWVFQPGRHKTKTAGKEIAYVVGPRARAVLTPWLAACPDPDGYLFPAGKASATRGRSHYHRHSLRKAVADACKAAKTPHWSPNQLRHSAATRYDKLAGLVQSSRILGHSSVDTTLTYVEAALQDSAQLVEQHG